MKKISVLFFIIPFIMTTLQVQSFIEKFVSVSLSQLFAYGNLVMIFIGILFVLKDTRREPLTKIIRLWLFFYALYYTIGLWGNIIYNNEVPLLKTLVAVVYFIGFSYFLGIKANRRVFENVIFITFTFTNLITIYFYKINFSMDYDGIYEYALNRAGGVYGDANNAAVICLMSFVFIYNLYNPTNKFLKILKFISLGIALYSLALTFSKTGFIVFLLVLAFTFHRFFSPRRIIISIIIMPLALYFMIYTALNSPSLSSVQKTRIQDVVNVITLNESKVHLSDRDVLFANMFNYIKENPIFGNGIYFSTSIRGHNTIFGIWADAGIFCFLFFLFLLFEYARKSVASEDDIKFFSLSVLAVLGVYMLTLQTILDQPYLIAIFVYLAYKLESKISLAG